MAITINLRYKGANARAFAEEMTASGTVDLIRAEAGNLRYGRFLRKIMMAQPALWWMLGSWNTSLLPA